MNEKEKTVMIGGMLITCIFVTYYMVCEFEFIILRTSRPLMAFVFWSICPIGMWLTMFKAFGYFCLPPVYDSSKQKKHPQSGGGGRK